MRTTAYLKASALTLCIGLSTGCADQSDNGKVLGAGLGAAVGCGVGAAAGGKEGCAAGAVAGAAAGWALTAQYQANQVRSAQEDQKIYGVTEPVSGTQVKIRKGSVAPTRVKPGTTVKILTDYSLMAPGGKDAVAVEESWVLLKDGETLSTLPPQRNNRTPGGWVADASIKIPENAKPGTYVVEHKVQSGSSYDSDESTFIVGG
jgi:hypothetical protein